MEKSYSTLEKWLVWQKGTPVISNDPNLFRKDCFGCWIKWNDYGDRKSKFGWEIDHINPKGPDISSNWQPLQWQNNLAKSDKSLNA